MAAIMKEVYCRLQYEESFLQLPWLQGITLECFSFKGTVQC